MKAREVAFDSEAFQTNNNNDGSSEWLYPSAFSFLEGNKNSLGFSTYKEDQQRGNLLIG